MAILQAKAADLVKFFECKKLPENPVRIHAWATITDVTGYIETQKARLQGQHDNPYSRVYISAYFALLDLKNFIENANNISGSSTNAYTGIILETAKCYNDVIRES